MSHLVLSLFPGLELLDHAFREQGFCVVAGPDKILGGDVRDFHLPAGRFDGVIGGSPCQAFSALANLVRATGLEPRFGNLVPEFARVVTEAAPEWFLHENVPRAPIPKPPGYAVRDFELCNSSIEGDDGLGQEQERVRRFTFGVRGGSCFACLPVTSQPGSPEAQVCATCGADLEAPNLLHWIPRAALRLPAGRRAHTVQGGHETPGNRRTSAVLAERLYRQATITGANAGARPKGGKSERRTIAEMLRLQGLPEDLLDEAPFTAKAKRRLIANGVPMPLGRAVAAAVVEAIKDRADPRQAV